MAPARREVRGVGPKTKCFGSWTLKKELREAGAEPDECSRVAGLSKPEIYRRLGVRELWTLRSDGRLVVRVLEQGEWIERAKSKLLPKLDLSWLVSFLDITPQSKAVRALRDAMRTKKRRN